ncbi:hypothetical protein [Psittacicella hinzii]|uniref:Uncharacterized protein n=1 Tax=Psittacicella hinzii TaxID=2028575 RepID=A0A3A1YFZ6_9GAMM|nr:hypothetical protein [Psittacicella hinzii]RIY36010.1 hypothetical protein CKF58_06390 [Psittacicella hinzii]
MAFDHEKTKLVINNLTDLLNLFVNLQSIKWSLIGVAFALFKFKKDGRVGVFHFWYELALVFFIVYLGAPVAIINGVPESYLPIMAAVIGYAGVNNVVKIFTQFINLWINYLISKYDPNKKKKIADKLPSKDEEDK